MKGIRISFFRKGPKGISMSCKGRIGKNNLLRNSQIAQRKMKMFHAEIKEQGL